MGLLKVPLKLPLNQVGDSSRSNGMLVGIGLKKMHDYLLATENSKEFRDFCT